MAEARQQRSMCGRSRQCCRRRTSGGSGPRTFYPCSPGRCPAVDGCSLGREPVNSEQRQVGTLPQPDRAPADRHGDENEALAGYRQQVIEAARGLVLEIGVGSGPKFPLYGAAVDHTSRPFSMYRYDGSYAVEVQRAHPDRFAIADLDQLIVTEGDANSSSKREPQPLRYTISRRGAAHARLAIRRQRPP
jgi:hypothetical protein